MHGPLAAALVLILVGSVSLAVWSPAAPASEGPRLVAVYPNPTLPDDRGEFIGLSIHSDTACNLSVTDGESAVTLLADLAPGEVAIATDPAVRNLTDSPGVLVARPLRLASGGERIELRRDGVLVEDVTNP